MVRTDPRQCIVELKESEPSEHNQRCGEHRDVERG
jgi:hypothetical protein